MLKAGEKFRYLTYLRSVQSGSNRKYVFFCDCCKAEVGVWARDMPSFRPNPICPQCKTAEAIFVFLAGAKVFACKALEVTKAYSLLPKADYEIYSTQTNGEAIRLGAIESALNSPEWRQSQSFLKWRESLLEGETTSPLPLPLDPSV